MDSMNIKSKFLRGIVGKLLEKGIRKKFGISSDVQLNDFSAHSDEQAHVHLDIDLTMSKDEFEKFVKGLI